MEMIVLIFVNVIQEDTPFNIINHLQFYISAIIGPFSACMCVLRVPVRVCANASGRMPEERTTFQQQV